MWAKNENKNEKNKNKNEKNIRSSLYYYFHACRTSAPKGYICSTSAGSRQPRTQLGCPPCLQNLLGLHVILFTSHKRGTVQGLQQRSPRGSRRWHPVIQVQMGLCPQSSGIVITIQRVEHTSGRIEDLPLQAPWVHVKCIVSVLNDPIKNPHPISLCLPTTPALLPLPALYPALACNLFPPCASSFPGGPPI